MPYASKREKRLYTLRECPGEVVTRAEDGTVTDRRPCTALISSNATVCRTCRTLFAPGALAAFPIRHARTKVTPKDWVARFMK